jgi:methionine-rich copper-binding protein CopC
MTRIISLLALAAFTPRAAIAHAMLLQASPAVGSTAPAPPAHIVLHFSEGVEPSFTTVEVTDSTGTRLDTGALRTEAGDQTTLIVTLKAGPPGSYAVIWRATSVDTHKTQGHFSFSVAP